MTGTKIITRINASEAAEDIGRLIGEQEVERRTQSETRTSGKLSVTESIQREIRRVVTSSELASRLGPTKGGVRVLFMGLGEAVYELELPYLSLPKLREPIMPADWTRPSTPKPLRQTNGEMNEGVSSTFPPDQGSGQPDPADAALTHGGIDLRTWKWLRRPCAITIICKGTITTAASGSRPAAGLAGAPSG
jgi:type IV secretory pathway TraG/TraD family ATPase VirD4